MPEVFSSMLQGTRSALREASWYASRKSATVGPRELRSASQTRSQAMTPCSHTARQSSSSAHPREHSERRSPTSRRRTFPVSSTPELIERAGSALRAGFPTPSVRLRPRRRRNLLQRRPGSRSPAHRDRIVYPLSRSSALISAEHGLGSSSARHPTAQGALEMDRCVRSRTPSIREGLGIQAAFLAARSGRRPMRRGSAGRRPSLASRRPRSASFPSQYTS